MIESYVKSNDLFVIIGILMNGSQSETLHDMRRFLGINGEPDLDINRGFETILKKYFGILTIKKILV